MNANTDFFYTKSHEWVKFLDETTALVGISDHAQSELGDLVYVNLPEAGDQLTVGDIFADVESVKAVSDIYAPVSGTVAEVNAALLDAPEAINQNASEAWFVKVENITERGDLMDAQAYASYCEAL